MKKLLSIILLSLASNCLAESLCSPNEEEVFSCDTKTKSISICAKSGNEDYNRRIRYLFGTKHKIELKFPNKDGKSPEQPFVSDFAYGPGFMSYIRFRIGAFKYFIYSDHGDDAWSESGQKMAVAFKDAGVVVFKDSVLVKQIKCASFGAELSEENIKKYGFPLEYDDLLWNSSWEP